MNEKCSFKNHKFDMFWDKVDTFSKVYMAVKLLGLPYKIRGVSMRFEFKTVDGKILCQQKRELKRNDNGNIKHIRIVCDGRDFVDAEILTITVIKLIDLCQHEIPKNEWVKYGFINSE